VGIVAIKERAGLISLVGHFGGGHHIWEVTEEAFVKYQKVLCLLNPKYQADLETV
jgi:hypothetical protein